MRTLVLVPIIHIDADLGKAKDEIKLVKNRFLSQKELNSMRRQFQCSGTGYRTIFKNKM